MSLITDFSSQRERNVGEILLKVQDDLLALKENLSNTKHSGVDLTALESALRKTQNGIRENVEDVAFNLNNQVRALPASALRQVAGNETIYDLKTGQGLYHHLHHVPVKKLGADLPPAQMTGPTPGEFAKRIHELKVLRNPQNAVVREVASKRYGITLPLINDRQQPETNQSKVWKGSQVGPLAVLPAANRRDPQLLPPPITENDAKQGIYSLVNRGLIPPAAELHLNPPPVLPQPAAMHDPSEKDKKIPLKDRNLYADSAKFDPDITETERQQLSAQVGTRQPSEDRALAVRSPSTKKSMLTARFQPMPPPVTPASGLDAKEKMHRFAIQNGKTREQTSEFATYKQHYCLSWGSIVTMIRYMEKFLQLFCIPIAFIDGDRLADLSLEYELEISPSYEDLLSCIINKEDVASMIKEPGRRYHSSNGKHLAASKIQATFRMYNQRLKYLNYRRQQWAAGVIAITWITSVKLTRLKKAILEKKQVNLEAFRSRARDLAARWDYVRNNKRLIIHVPSLGYSETIRSSIANMGLWQNAQMARICDIKDPNVDVIYISPVPINEEMAQYYGKLMSLRSAVRSGNVDEQMDMSDRFKVITPEAVKSFPNHRMSLSTVLRYSSKTLLRLKALVKGREAIMVTGVPNSDDLEVANILDIPILCPEPDVAHLYSTKSGNKRIFASASVPLPYCEYDIYSITQLYEALSQLIIDNILVTRWMLKLDTEFDGRGIAYLDVAEHLPSYAFVLREAERYGDKWSKRWAQDTAYMKIHTELPKVLEQHLTIVNTAIYNGYKKYMKAFLSKGGIVEAYPPSDSVTNLTIDMLVEPDGTHSIVCLGDQVHADSPFRCWGLSFPQSSVEPAVVNDICYKTAAACKKRSLIGYITIDLVTFIHPKTVKQEIWATDLSFNYSDSVAMYNMLSYMTAGTLDPKNHFYQVDPPKKDEKKVKRKIKSKEDDEPTLAYRYAVLSTRLYHTNLSVVHYSVFFQMCRAHGIGYDVKEKQGTVFTIVDSAERENLGMITISESLQTALAIFARNLSVIHQEISAPKMQGKSNFRSVIEDIEAILGTAEENEETGPQEQIAST